MYSNIKDETWNDIMRGKRNGCDHSQMPAISLICFHAMRKNSAHEHDLPSVFLCTCQQCLTSLLKPLKTTLVIVS